MAPNPIAVGGLLRQVIHYHLDNASCDNALFFAERLTAQEPKSSDALHLYALCHLRVGDFRSAYDVAKPIGYRGIHLGCAWVFAQACMALERYKDGIVALEKSRGLWSQKCSIGKHSPTTRAANPDIPTVLCLLGKLHRAYGDKKKAVSCFEEALKKNPFIWDAFTALCDMGINVRVPNIFRSNEVLTQSFELEPGSALADGRENISANPLDPLSRRPAARSVTTELGIDPFNGSFPHADMSSPVVDMFTEPGDDFMSKIQSARLRLAASTNSQPSVDAMDTPTGTPLTDPTASRSGYPSHDPPQAPPRRARNGQPIDHGIEAPPRMNYRLGAKRNVRPQERGQEQPPDLMSDAPNAPMAGFRSGALNTADRKRTLSGHPVPRSANSEEPATRRSARLNMFKPSTRANAGASTIGASAGRELKKARPPVSRIVRPGSSGSSVGRVVSGNRKPLEDPGDADHGQLLRTKEAPQPAASRLPEPDAAKMEEALRWILDLVKKLGGGYYLLSRFQCQEALQALSALPSAHQGTPWVLAQMGRAHYEQASYAEAEKFFRRMRVQAPSRLQDMEVYSTILWHLKRETDLSFLAHELVESAWHSPQAWCALGNAWSLARDPEQALKCFKRATQLDPKFAYAFTLQGHEHVSNEEYEKALTAYRQAIAADRRHYNAYYGIGRVQERLGAYDKAYDHFYAAQIINPNNAVLICCMGTALEKQKQMVQALNAYTRAADLAPRAAQTRYKKARALLTVGQVEAAQRELMILKDLAPEEATVHFLLGTLYKNTNEKQLSVRHFTIALSLDPKAAPKIKEAIESFEDVPMDDSMMA
ncbi:tetratricopeptide repeat domain-containing protein [Hirsutella rhossiliensis]|uniref:Tetratricopeptide repeat domain-containing protein n=1 Tax=Hirsutella rhossiliensis TaxID=111463 RepID=A0A9P8N095_9HYPO|nr:tetratricopeptide repeat domain-containing protein [Hirsutella rhossiliensis]KAH0963551.1 tetratricopeptide repeat domain-containing protein [Hirsutella rhossiliensis]